MGTGMVKSAGVTDTLLNGFLMACHFAGDGGRMPGKKGSDFLEIHSFCKRLGDDFPLFKGKVSGGMIL